MTEASKKKQPLSWWRRILLALVLTAMAPFIFLLLADYLAKRQLGDEISKITKAGQPITFLDLLQNSEPNNIDQDAARYYAEAISNMPLNELENLKRLNIFYRKNIIALPAKQFPSDAREKTTQSLTVLQPFLEKFDNAALLPLSQFDIGIQQGIQVYKNHLNLVETAVLLLSVRTLNLIVSGQDDAAADSAISLLKLLRIFDTFPTMVLNANKSVFVNHACQDIHLLLEYGRPSEKSLANLQKALAETITTNIMEKVFLVERIYQTEIGRNLIPGNIASQLLQQNAPALPERLSLPTSSLGCFRMRRKAAQFFRDIAKLITISRRPWPDPLDTIVNLSQSTQKPTTFISNAATSVRLTAKSLAIVNCTILAVATERYRLSHSQLPASLNDLSPEYIDSLPPDPFTGKNLLFKYDDETYLIYSVGDNRQDDAGSIIPKPDEQTPLDYGLRIPLQKPQ
jgi:hypothetical protein